MSSFRKTPPASEDERSKLAAEGWGLKICLKSCDFFLYILFFSWDDDSPFSILDVSVEMSVRFLFLCLWRFLLKQLYRAVWWVWKTPGNGGPWADGWGSSRAKRGRGEMTGNFKQALPPHLHHLHHQDEDHHQHHQRQKAQPPSSSSKPSSSIIESSWSFTRREPTESRLFLQRSNFTRVRSLPPSCRRRRG